jgi:RsiW-degrading membrane proteinase PrsW (M82 family)
VSPVDSRGGEDRAQSGTGGSPVPIGWRLLAPLVAAVGSVVGLVGAAFEESQHGILLGPFIAAPIIEEALKPSGVFFLLAKRPNLLSSRAYTAFLAALGGLTFGIIENIIYLKVYFPEHSYAAALVRWTAGLALHTSASFIVGLGINSKLVAAAKGEIPLFSANKRYFIIPMVMHSAYNIAGVLLGGRLK